MCTRIPIALILVLLSGSASAASGWHSRARQVAGALGATRSCDGVARAGGLVAAGRSASARAVSERLPGHGLSRVETRGCRKF